MSRRSVGEGIGVLAGLVLGVVILGVIALSYQRSRGTDLTAEPQSQASGQSTDLQVRSAENELPSNEGARVLQPNVSGQSDAVPEGENCASGTQVQALQGAVCINPQDL